MKPVSQLPAKVKQCLDRYVLQAGPLVVAVSGGPDSVALLRALLECQDSEARTVVIAHLNHQLRGAESDGDEEFVRALFDSLSATATGTLHLRLERADLAAIARATRSNLESVARRVRYDWLARVAREVDSPYVVTGHTADDQAETVLHRLLRGTGLKGLAGIPPRRRLAPGVELLRPLLGVTRAEVLAYLEAVGQSYRQDSSNAERKYTRNRIRHELLPHLARRYNPAIVPLLCRLAEQAAEAQRLGEQRARDLLNAAERPRAGSLLIFDKGPLREAPRHVVREMFRLAWSREAWPQVGMGFREWDRLAAVALDELTAVDLPAHIQARGRERVVQLGEVH